MKVRCPPGCLGIVIYILAVGASEVAWGDEILNSWAGGDHLTTTDAQNRNRHGYCARDIGALPNNDYSSATGINNQREIVGDSGNSSFLYRGDDTLLRIEPLPGDDSTSAFSINGLGIVVGSSAKIGHGTVTQPFVYSRGKIMPIAGIDDGIAYGINESGQIVGAARGLGPFLYSEGKVVSLGKESGAAFAINDKGDVVGRTDTDRAFLFRDGKMVDLGTLLGHSYRSAHAINNRGQVVGVSAPTGIADARAFLYQGVKMVDLGTLESEDSYSVATDVNDSGVIVGFSGTNPDFYATSGLRAFVYSDGKMTDLNALVYKCSEMILTAATSINDRGEIVGRGVRHNQLHAFVLRLPQESERERGRE